MAAQALTLHQFLQRCARDFEYFARHCLKIRVKTAEGVKLAPFVLNREQREVLSWVMHCVRMGLPIRIIIDKCRKLGMSTLSQGLAFWLCQFRPLYRATVVAQSNVDTGVVQQIGRTFTKNLPPMFAGTGPRSANGFLIWDHDEGRQESWFRGITQGADAGGRGDDPLFFHLSEVAFWDEGRSATTAEGPITSYVGSLDDLPWTFIIIESTANGQAGAFYDRYRLAESIWSNPAVSDDLKVWRPFFFSWQGVEKYSARVSDEVRAHHDHMLQIANTDVPLAERLWQRLPYSVVFRDHSREFFTLAVEHGLTAEECAWAATKLSGLGHDANKFHQEYPLTWQMSFITSGRPVLKQRVINEWMAAPSYVDRQGGQLVEQGGKIVLDEAGDAWQFFGTPHPDIEGALVPTWDPSHPDNADDQYIVATDSAAGAGGGDYAALRVWSRRRRAIVAEAYSQSMPPDVLGYQAVLAARFWSNAYIIPEFNNHGAATVDVIVNRLRYHNVHCRITGRNVTPGTAWTAIWGWVTSPKTKPPMIDELAQQVRLRSYVEPSKRFCDEAKGFVFDQWGKPVTMSGCHDDLIDTTALIFQAEKALPSMSPMTLTSQPEKRQSQSEAALERVREHVRRQNRPARTYRSAMAGRQRRGLA